MLRTLILVSLAAWGCAALPDDERPGDADFERLPVAALAPADVAVLEPCGDAVPDPEDSVARLDDGSDTIVVLHDGEPECTESLESWLSADPASADAASASGEQEKSSDMSDDDEPDAEDQPDTSAPVNGPRPIPWKADRGQPKVTDDK